ncbi:MAG: LysR family transcriptional regulator [Inquilinus sp.]|nr:LysR family transcriptional regulator [Inquilinus sp.]
MDRFRELSAFVAVADEDAFNAAARRLNVSPAAVTRLVTSLEARLGVRLFTRTTRRVALTEAGRRLRVDAGRVLAELEEAEASAAGAHEVPRGVLRVTAPVLFGQRFIAPILRRYLDAYPAVTAGALFVDRIVDMIDEGLDVAVRIGDLPDSSLTAIRAGAVRRVTVAAPDYLERRGTPRRPDDLKDHRVVHPAGLSGNPDWEFSVAGRRQSVRLAPALAVNTMIAAIDATVAGWGVTRALSYQVADAIAAGELVEILSDFEDRAMPIHLLHSEGRRAAAKIRAFVDLAATALRRDTDRLAAL